MAAGTLSATLMGGKRVQETAGRRGRFSGPDGMVGLLGNAADAEPLHCGAAGSRPFGG